MSPEPRHSITPTRLPIWIICLQSQSLHRRDANLQRPRQSQACVRGLDIHINNTIEKLSKLEAEPVQRLPVHGAADAITRGFSTLSVALFPHHIRPPRPKIDRPRQKKAILAAFHGYIRIAQFERPKAEWTARICKAAVNRILDPVLIKEFQQGPF